MSFKVVQQVLGRNPFCHAVGLLKGFDGKVNELLRGDTCNPTDALAT